MNIGMGLSRQVYFESVIASAKNQSSKHEQFNIDDAIATKPATALFLLALRK